MKLRTRNAVNYKDNEYFDDVYKRDKEKTIKPNNSILKRKRNFRKIESQRNKKSKEEKLLESVKLNNDTSESDDDQWEDIKDTYEKLTDDLHITISQSELIANDVRLRYVLRLLLGRLLKQIRIALHKACILSVIALGRNLMRIKSNVPFSKNKINNECCRKGLNFLQLPTNKSKQWRLLIAYVAPSINGPLICSCKSRNFDNCHTCKGTRSFFSQDTGKLFGWIEIKQHGHWVKDRDPVRACCRKNINYIIAFEQSKNKVTVMDLTKEYIPSNWYSLVRSRQRLEKVDEQWYQKIALIDGSSRSYNFPDNLKKYSYPAKIDDFKDHPLYVLERHLLKFEALYPKNIQPLSTLRNEKIFPRSAVVKLHSISTWLKQGREIRCGQEPYKIVKARRKKYNIESDKYENQDLGLYGEWQTCPYKPPIATNGCVPRNDYGNVDLFTSAMLPIGCVHLTDVNSSKACKNLGVDFAAATVDFDAHGGHCHPVYNGIVICSEYHMKVINEIKRLNKICEQRNIQRKKAKAKKLWILFAKGLLIQERLK